METYTCNCCGYCYDPADGEPACGLAPGVAFADIPAGWACPGCGVGPTFFLSASDMARMEKECVDGGCELTCHIPCF